MKEVSDSGVVSNDVGAIIEATLQSDVLQFWKNEKQNTTALALNLEIFHLNLVLVLLHTV